MTRSRLLSLGPMCFYPPRDGASLRILEVAKGFAESGYSSTVIGRDFIVDFTPDGGERLRRFEIRWMSRSEAIFRTLLSAGHYNEVKHTNRRWFEMVEDYLRGGGKFDVVIINTIWMDGLLDVVGDEGAVAFDTQNSEWKLFDHYLEGSRNPLVRRIVKTSRRRLDKIMARLPDRAILMHISAADLEDHRARRPEMCHLLVPSGCASTPRTAPPNYGVGRKRMIFLGNLSNKMNNDALAYFAETFWPTLTSVAEFTVAGSNPSPAIAELCRVHGWELHGEFADDEKMGLYNRAHFAILPFRYGTGSKLKMLEACGHGIPVLTTEAGNCGGAELPSFVTVSDSPTRWRDILVGTSAYDPRWAEDAADFAGRNSQREALAPLIAEVESRFAVRAKLST